MVTKAKKALLASLAAFLCVMLTVFGLSMSVSTAKIAKADDTTAVAKIGETTYAKLSDAVTAAAEGDTVTLRKDTTEDVVVNKNITLDLGGKTLTGTNTGNATLTIAKGATATVKNGSVKGTSSFYNIQNNGTATFESLTATAGNTDSSMIDNYGTLTITSGVYSGGLNVVKSEAGSTLTINGGKFTLNFSADGYTGVIYAYGDTTINGGEFIQETNLSLHYPQVVITGVVKGYTATTKVTGGSFINKSSYSYCKIFHGYGKATYDNFEVSGGTFNKSISEGYCANGFIPTRNADGTYGVKLGKYVVDVEGDGYETLAEAVAAAESGDTITLLADIANTDYTVANVINIKLAEGVTLDGNNHTLSGNVKITVASAGGVTIQNVKFKDIHNDKVIDSDSKTKYGFSDDKVGTLSAIYASNLNGSLTVMDCEFENVDWDAMQITPATGAEVVIKNNIFKVSESETVKEQLRHVHIEMAYGGGVDYEGTDISLTVTDNQFFDKNVTSIGAWWIGKGSNLALSGNYYADPDSASITLSDKSFNRENRVDLIYPARSTADVDVDDLTATVMVIKDAFNSATYSTLAEAIAATEDGQTIKLLADITENGMDIAKSITIDFDGHTLTVEGEMVGSSGTVTNALRFLKNGDTTNTVVLKNGKIVSTTARILIQNYSSLTVDGMVLDLSGQRLYGYVLSNNNGNTVIKDTTISAPAAERSLAFDVCGFSTYGDVSVTMEGKCVINGNVMFSTDEPTNKQNVELILNGGIINGSLVDGGGSEDIIIRKSDNVDIAAPAGYFWNSEGVLKIAVAKIGEKNYATLQAAFDAAKTGDTVKLLADITLTAQVNITKALNGLTLDGNGKTITCATTTDVFASGGSALYFGNATDKLYCTGIKIKDLTMTGKARFAIFLCGGTTTEFTNVNISGDYYIAVNLYGTHGATMTNCNISNSTTGTDKYISGIWSNVASANPLRLVNTKVDVITINAYTTANTLAPKIFIDKDSSAEVHTFDDGSVSGDKTLCVSKTSEGTYTVKEYDATNTEWVEVAVYVAEVNGAKYTTLQAAIDVATSGATVTLLSYVEENVTIANDITLDLNGYTINGGTGTTKAAITNHGTLTITDSSEAKTGTIKRDDNGDRGYYVILNLGTMTIEQANVVNNSGHDGSSLIRNGGNDKGANLTINGGKLTQLNFIAIKNDANGILVVNGGEITSNQSAIQNWYNATITGGTIKGQLWTDAWTEGGSVGNTVIGGNVDYEGEIVMDVTGSSIKPTLTVNGGNLSVTNWIITTACAKLGGKPAISGGTFSSEVEKDYLAKGYRLTKTGESYGVTEKYIASSTVSLGVDLSFKYEMVKGKSVDRVVASYYKVNETEATKYELTNVTIDGVVYYVFNGITPQMIDRKISVDVYVGNTVIYDVVEYSILDNLGAVLKKELGSKQDVTRQLVASLAYYGKAAMEYVKYDSSAVQKFIDDNKLPHLTAEIKDGVVAKYDSNETKIARISVQFADTNKVLVGVDEKVFDNYNYTIMVNGQEITSIDWQTGVVSGYNVYVSEGFAARYITDASKYVEVEVLDKNNNNNRVQYVKYNVAGYCMMMKDNATMGALATATYYYGVAAANYAA